MELASTSESLVKNRFISRKNTSCYFPSRTERQNPNETLLETKVTRLLSDSEKGKTEGRCGEIRTPGVYIICLMFVLSVQTVPIIFSVALLLQLPPTVQQHDDQVDEVLSSM